MILDAGVSTPRALLRDFCCSFLSPSFTRICMSLKLFPAFLDPCTHMLRHSAVVARANDTGMQCTRSDRDAPGRTCTPSSTSTLVCFFRRSNRFWLSADDFLVSSLLPARAFRGICRTAQLVLTTKLGVEENDPERRLLDSRDRHRRARL